MAYNFGYPVRTSFTSQPSMPIIPTPTGSVNLSPQALSRTPSMPVSSTGIHSQPSMPVFPAAASDVPPLVPISSTGMPVLPASSLALQQNSRIFHASPALPVSSPALPVSSSLPRTSIPKGSTKPVPTSGAPERDENNDDSGKATPYSTSARVPEQGRYHQGDMSITLEPEFYTAAFVSPLHLHQQRKWYERAGGEAFFTLGMIGVAIMQCLTVFGMASYLAEKDSGYMDEFKLGTGLFTTGGATLSQAHSKDLCGTFNHIGLHQLAGVNTIGMTDGTTFQGTPDFPMFHSYKMPSGRWTFHSIGGDESYIDKQLRIVHDVSVKDNLGNLSNFRVEYGVLLVIMVGWLWYHVLYEIQKILKFSFVLTHFWGKGLVKGSHDTTDWDPDTGEITIVGLTYNAFAVGCLSATLRITVVIMMLIWGTSLLASSSNKLSLVLNSLAIGIVFELDVIIAYAVIDHNTMQRIENIKPVTVTALRETLHYSYYMDLLFSIAMFIAVLGGALMVRHAQVNEHIHQLHNAAALCLFAGPTPEALPNVMAPVPGFCESLLSLTCAPNVSGAGNSSSQHGPCLVTDMNVFHDKSMMLYADTDIFEGMHDKNGKRRSMADWGPPAAKLRDTWTDDQHLNLFRRVCTQLYDPSSNVDKRIVDQGLSLTMYSAPFYCPREELFDAVFGDVKHDFNHWASTLDLKSDKIFAALDRCHKAKFAYGKKNSTAVAPTVTPENSHALPVAFPAELAKAYEAPDGIRPAASNLLRHPSHHKVHRHHDPHKFHRHHARKIHHKAHQAHHEVSRLTVKRLLEH